MTTFEELKNALDTLKENQYVSLTDYATGTRTTITKNASDITTGKYHVGINAVMWVNFDTIKKNEFAHTLNVVVFVKKKTGIFNLDITTTHLEVKNRD